MSDSRCTCVDHAAHRAPRVVLTGGPGAGKTAVLEVVRRQLCPHVEVLPEAASILFGGGFPRRKTPVALRAAQIAIFHVQDQLEVVAVEREPPALVLCDRGIIDGYAYWPEGAGDYWSAVGTTHEAALRRYDVVIHMRVPGEGNGYDRSTNPVRTETAEEAARIDARIAEVWAGHPHLHVVESQPDFRTKLAAVLDLIERYVPPCCRRRGRPT
jgi:predicted ATPase